ncbi:MULTISPECIES: hypothetical protein [unclassified Paludibacterium]|uniref:hypothetical protein n=1 Tax=unclassified Paludibacterium TaxID=2618429 RepID=UPI001C04DCEB|nr:hypothetical protein [Paludibacterium sp. B53371]BEV71105.1 hypothetical protein THUN1379_05870 [Paludibacterium sp. THUN1379]
MYDWNALWHCHQGYRTGYDSPQQDINQLAAELGAQLVKPASHPGDVAVYDQGEQFLLVGHEQGLQLLHLAKHALFDIQVRFVPDLAPAPCVEVYVRNQATGEEDSWRTEVRREADGQIWLGKRLLSEGSMPAMPFDALSFTDNARFRDLLYNAWQQALPRLQQEIGNWRPQADLEARQLARYRALLQVEQARMKHRFDQQACDRLRLALAGHHFDQPQDCRGLWLIVEHYWVSQAAEQDWRPLLDTLRSLDFAAEIALIEWLQ